MSELLRLVPELAFVVAVFAAMLYGGILGFGLGMTWERWFRERFEGWRARSTAAAKEEGA